MDLGLGNTLLAGDPRLVDHIVGEVKSQGIFDQFRKECIADVDTKPAYQNLRTRVESSVNSFLGKQVWRADLNKNQLRETLRKHIHDAPYLDAGVERIVDQVVNPKVYSVFMPQIEEVVYKFLGLERPRARDRNGSGLKDLLPKDLDPVSPESDKNSLKDVSLDSVDAEIGNGGDSANFVEESDSKNTISGNGVSEGSESLNEVAKISSALASSTVNLDNSGRSEDKTEEEEEESPVFEPIDIMNLNESNISNDSHLSGISELTSHRSRSPDFSNETSRDNMDFSNQDSQFSKVSSDSRLSIVTDFGSSNHASGPDTPKEDKEKNEAKFGRDNFRAIRDFDGTKVKESRVSYDGNSGREEAKSGKRSSSSKETSRDGTESSKDASESKEKPREESSKSKNAKDFKKADKDPKRKSSDGKSDKTRKVKEKSESSKDAVNKESLTKPRDDKVKDNEKKESSLGKEVKDLKDIYKEKIRELREKKELTEKEKLSRDTKSSKETKEKRDSSREVKKDSKDSKDSKSASSKGHSSRSESKSSRSEGKSSKSESRSSKRDDRKSSKESRSKSQGGSDSSEKVDARRPSKSEKDEKSEKSEIKQDSKSKSSGKSSKNDSNRNSDGKRDSKSDLEARDKKRRDDKKSKIKDDHSSARKSSDDRRSTDRDGSNGSNGRTSQKNNSTPSATTNKSVTSSLSKESTTTSNSSSETSDSIEERQNEKSVINIDTKFSKAPKNQADTGDHRDTSVQRLDVGSDEIHLPMKKRSHNTENQASETLMKKPKFAKNFQEAKRLMKIRRRMEREKLKIRVETEVEIKSQEPPSPVPQPPKKIVEDDLKLVPDEERVQIIEVCDEEYDEPYPEVQSDFTLEERSQIILGGESIFTSDFIAQRFNAKSTLSEMELSIRQSLKEMISDKLDEPEDTKISPETETGKNVQEPVENSSNFIDIETTIFGNSSLCSEIAENVKASSKNGSENEKNKKSLINENAISASEKDELPKDFETGETIETTANLKAREDEHKADDNVEEMCEFKEIVKEMAKMEGNSDIGEFSGAEVPKLEPKDETTENSEIICVNDEKVKNSENNSIEIATVENEIKIDEQISTNETFSEKSEKSENSEQEINTYKNVEKGSKSIEPTESETECREYSEGQTEITKTLEKDSTTSANSEDETKKSDISKHEVKITEDDEKMFEKKGNAEETLQQTVNAQKEPEVEGIVVQPEAEEATAEKWPQPNGGETCNNQEDESSLNIVKEEEKSLCMSDDEAPCLYFVEDTEKLTKFRKFLKSLEHEESLGEDYVSETSSNETVCTISKTMAPPKPKRKYSTSPLTDILLNNANNNNDAHKTIESTSDSEDTSNNMKKRKIGRPKKQKINANLCTQQNLSNGENFVMPLSPESDVSATSEKTPSNPLKDEKNRPRGSNQRYTSDDLYKPRPLFSSSSRRSRRSNQA